MVRRLWMTPCSPSLTTSKAQEIATLRREAQAFRRVRIALRSPNNNEEPAKLAFEKVCCCAEFG